jgi:hypothetical protein
MRSSDMYRQSMSDMSALAAGGTGGPRLWRGCTTYS